jgi:hypothetical protein
MILIAACTSDAGSRAELAEQPPVSSDAGPLERTSPPSCEPPKEAEPPADCGYPAGLACAAGGWGGELAFASLRQDEPSSAKMEMGASVEAKDGGIVIGWETLSEGFSASSLLELTSATLVKREGPLEFHRSEPGGIAFDVVCSAIDRSCTASQLEEGFTRGTTFSFRLVDDELCYSSIVVVEGALANSSSGCLVREGDER